MRLRLLARSMFAASLAVGLLLLMPSRASAVSFTITEPAIETGNTSADCAGCAVFQTHPPLVEEIGTHGEWSLPGVVVPGAETFHFAFCESGTSCSGTIPGIGDINPNNTNFLTDLTGAGINLPNIAIDIHGVSHNFTTEFGITSFTLIDLGAGAEQPGEGLSSLFGVANLSDFLTLNIGPHVAPNNISLDGQFNSDGVPEPASLVLLGTGLIGGGLRYRRRRKSA